MPSRARFVPNRSFERELTRTRAFQGALEQIAERPRALSQAFASAAITGGAIIPRDGVPRGQNVRVAKLEDGVAVVNTDHGSAIVEWGSRNSSPIAPLRRGVQAAGLRLREEGRR